MSEPGKPGDSVPEGGWGWMVAIAMAVMFTVTSGPLSSFGLLFGDFLADLGEGTQAVTVISSIFFTCFSFTGLVTNYALHSYSCRQVGILGSILFSLGSTFTIFSMSVPYMYIFYGVVQGVGMGLMVPSTFASFNTYFIHKRTFAMSIGQVIIGAAMALFPILIQEMVARYGFRGAQAISTAISMNTIVAMALLRPVGSPKVSGGDGTEGNDVRDRTIHASQEETNKKSLQLDVEGNQLYQKLEDQGKNGADISKHSAMIADVPKTLEACETSLLGNSEYHDGLKLEEDSFLTKIKLNMNPRPSIASIKSWTLPGSLNLVSNQDPQKRNVQTLGKKSVCKGIVDFLDLTLLKDPVYVSIALGISFAFYADITFFTIFPLIMIDLSFSNNDAAYCMAVGAAGDLLGRVFIAGLGLTFPSIKSRSIFFWGVLLSVICRAVFISFTNFTALCILTGLTGFFRSWIMVPAPLVFAEHCPGERFPSAYGLYMVINGVIAIVAGPFVGFIRDFTSSYPICVHSLNLMAMVCVVLWITEAVVVKLKSK